jgi:hypothetical protein
MRPAAPAGLHSFIGPEKMEMRTGNIIGLLVTLACTALLGACNGTSPTASDALRAGAASMDQQAETPNSGGVVGSGHDVVASDTTGRGGVFVGSGH